MFLSYFTKLSSRKQTQCKSVFNDFFLSMTLHFIYLFSNRPTTVNRRVLYVLCQFDLLQFKYMKLASKGSVDFMPA